MWFSRLFAGILLTADIMPLVFIFQRNRKTTNVIYNYTIYPNVTTVRSGICVAIPSVCRLSVVCL